MPMIKKKIVAGGSLHKFYLKMRLEIQKAYPPLDEYQVAIMISEMWSSSTTRKLGALQSSGSGFGEPRIRRMMSQQRRYPRSSLLLRFQLCIGRQKEKRKPKESSPVEEDPRLAKKVLRRPGYFAKQIHRIMPKAASTKNECRKTPKHCG